MFILTEQPFFGSEESSACFRINRLQLGLLSKGFCGQLAGYIIYMWKLSKLVVPQNDHNANKLYITRGGYPLVMLSILLWIALFTTKRGSISDPQCFQPCQRWRVTNPVSHCCSYLSLRVPDTSSGI